MKRGDDVIAFLRRYFSGDAKARLWLYLTSTDQDHAGCRPLLAKDVKVAYFDPCAAPHHGGQSGLTAAGEWRDWEVEFSRASGLELSNEEIVKLGQLRANYAKAKQSTEYRRKREYLRRVRIGQPPRAAAFTLFLIPKKNREHLIGDLEEEYRAIVLPEYGRFWARAWYWEQTLLAVGFYLWPLLKRILGLAMAWKVIGK